jgi:TolB-like protein
MMGPQRKHCERHRLASGASLVVLVLAALVACGGRPAYFRGEVAGVDTLAIAVLPLVNFSKYERASDVVVSALIVEMLDVGTFSVVDPGLVETVVLERRLRLTDRLSLEALRDLGQRLGVTHVMVGTVNEFGFVQDQAGQLPTVSISLRAVACADGRIVWAATHARRGDDAESVFGLGRIESLEQLAAVTVKEMTATLKP